MTKSEDEELRRYYDSADTSAEIERAQLDDSTPGQRMVGITIRLPVATLDAARAVARQEGVKVTALLRDWVEQRVGGGVGDDAVVPVSELRRVIAHAARRPPAV